MEIKRIDVDINSGLSIEDINNRKKEGLINCDTNVKTKSVKEIVLKNIFTIFNIINFILAIAVLFTGSFKNLLFMGGIIANTIISIFQELRSKFTLDKLEVINQAKINVLRDKNIVELGINDIVLDDLLLLELGNQIVVDSIIVDGEVEVNESFITGEAHTIYKKKGDMLLSGSFIVSGKCKAVVEHIGLDNYTAKISSQTKSIQKMSSEIMVSVNRIIMGVSFLIIPLGVLLFYKQLHLGNNTVNEAILNTVAALIGMIPEGLVLLTSTVLAVGIIRLAASKVLVQDLYSIEALARVDTVCLDKTGTITEGIMEVSDVVVIDSKYDYAEIIANINFALDENNPTGIALKNKFNKKDNYKVIKKIPFNSKNKYSGVSFKEGNFLIGAPEFLLDDTRHIKDLDKYINDYRVLVLTCEKNVIALILLQDIIRKEAYDTLKYFEKQGVKVKIISGDNPKTVYNIGLRAGLSGDVKYIDARELDTDKKIYENIKKYDVFGRVSPEQKRKFILALKKHGHVVAMTGDGVNDVLALKESDCSVAMASGTEAAKNVSQLVLMDSNFASMPHIVSEGRRSINNIQRSASLFLVKTIYATLLAILFLFISSPYPYIPIQLTLTSVLTIGVPSVILALEPNNNRITGNFLENVLTRAFPPAIIVVLNVLIVTLAGSLFKFSRLEISTLTVLVTTFTLFVLLYKTCKPFNLLHYILYFSMLILFIILFFSLKKLFNFSNFSILMGIVFACCIIISLYLYVVLESFIRKNKKN